MGHGAWSRSVFLTETRHYCLDTATLALLVQSIIERPGQEDSYIRDTATLALLVQSTFIFVEMKIEIAKAGASHRNISNNNYISNKLRCAAPKGCGIIICFYKY